MAIWRVLLLDADGLTAYRCDRTQTISEACFRHDSGDFSAYLAAHADDPFSLLVNLPDESFEAANVPHVRGWGRAAMMARKQERHAHGSPLCMALPRGREPDGRRDDRFLFVALTGMSLVQPWLDRIEQAEIALGGVYSVSQIMARLGDRSSGDPFLLASFTRGGLRQTFVAEGRLRFSRLTALAGGTTAELAAACLHEARQLHRYLCAQRLTEHDRPLPVLMLLPPGQMREFQSVCADTSGLRFGLLDLQAEAKRGGLVSLPDSNSDAFFAHRLARSSPSEQFAPAPLRRQWRLRRIGQALDTAGFIALAASIAFAAVQLPGALRMRDEAVEFRASNDADESAHLASQANIPALSLPAQELLELALARHALARTSPGPAPLLRSLSWALDRSGTVELESVDWRIAGTTAPEAILDVRGSVPDGAPARHWQQGVRELVDRLSAEPGIRAQIVKLPFDMDSGRTVTNADLSKDGNGFVVRLTRAL